MSKQTEARARSTESSPVAEVDWQARYEELEGQSGWSRSVSPYRRIRLCRHLGDLRTALDFAEDLRRIRLREPILAVPPSLALRTLRWAQRHPGVAIAYSLVSLGRFQLLVVLKSGNFGSRDFYARAAAPAAR